MPDTVWLLVIVVAVVIVVGAIVSFRTKRRELNSPPVVERKQTGSLSVEDLGLIPQVANPDLEAEELGRLRQSLMLKTMYNPEVVDRLVANERERMPAASDLELYRAAVERWERDNR